MARRLLTFVLVVIGLAMDAVGVFYFTVNAGTLPSVFPGHAAGSNSYCYLYAGSTVAIGVAMLGLALLVPSFARHR
jgi:hypothetical protein